MHGTRGTQAGPCCTPTTRTNSMNFHGQMGHLSEAQKNTETAVCAIQTCSGSLKGPSGCPVFGEPTPSYPECHPACLEFRGLARQYTGNETLHEFPVWKRWRVLTSEWITVSTSNYNVWNELKWVTSHTEIVIAVPCLELFQSVLTVFYKTRKMKYTAILWFDRFSLSKKCS